MALIPSERLMDWEAGATVGVIGGIPLDRPVYDDNGSGVTTALAGIDNTGSTDVTSAIYTEILAATTGTKVVLPSGTFQITGMPLRSNVTFAGQGPGVTILDVRGVSGVVISGDPSWGNEFNSISDIASGLTAGSTSIVVDDISGGLTAFTAGSRLCQIYWPNDPDIPVASPYGFPNLRKWYCMVTGIAGSTLTITPPIPGDLSEAAGAVIIQTQLPGTVYAGVESMTVDGSIADTMTVGIGFDMTANCWAHNIRIRGQGNYGMQLAQGCHMEISKVWVEPYLIDPLASNHAGFVFANLSGAYVYDNIMESNFPGMEMNHSTAGSVFAYNLVLCNIFGLHTNHAPHNFFNLYEGNIVSTFISDGYFGSESDLTIFRNWVFGYAPVDDSNLWTIALKRWTRAGSIVSNILRTAAFPGTDNGLSLGYPNIGNSDNVGTVDTADSEWWRDFATDTVNTPYAGEITLRTDANHGELTLTAGTASNFDEAMRGDNIISVINGSLTYVMSRSGNVLTLDSTNGGASQLDALPALSSTGPVWAGSGGFQELDEQVEGTLVAKGNLQYNTGTIDAPTAPDSVPDSLYLPSKPAWFYDLEWPPVVATAPATFSYSLIPAGYRYENGGNDPPSGATTSFDGSGSTTFTGSGSVTFA